MKAETTAGIAAKTLQRSKAAVAAVLVATLGAVLLSLLPPQLLRLIIDRNLSRGVSDGLQTLAACYLAVVVLLGAFNFFKGVLLSVLGQRIIKELRIELHRKLQRLGMQYFTQNSAADITSRFTNDVETINTLFSDGIISMLVDCLKIVGIVVSVALFSRTLGLVIALVIPFLFMITRAFQRRMLRAQTDNLKQLGNVNTHISESLNNIEMIQSYAKEAWMEQRYEEKLCHNFKTIERVNFYDSCYAPIIQLTRALVIASVVVLSCKQWNLSGISLGMVAASIDLVSGLFAPVEALGMELQSIQKGLSGARRINVFLAEKEEPPRDDTRTAAMILKNRTAAQFEFDHVSFTYADGVTPVLQDLCLSVAVGTNVTFTGRSGVGKTTLFKLIMGLETPTCGRITLNGVEVCRIPNKEKRRLLGYVEQNFSFVKGTVAQQISMEDPSVSREQIENVLRFVGLYDMVSSMEQGMDTVVCAQNTFSQGQKQLLAIARAIVTDPPVLLLDEVTANLDSATEDAVMQILRKAGSHRTILSVSHRLASMLRCDQVVVLEEGKIRAAGTPQELAETDPWFSQLLRENAGHLER